MSTSPGITTLLLPIALTNGNAGRTQHFGASAARRRKYERIIRTMFPNQKPFDTPVLVKVTRVLGRGQRYFDSSSVLRGNYKEIEDALVAAGFFHDDSRTWIRNTIPDQDNSRREIGPAVEITITPLQEEPT
jgi:hypothetical protein